MKRFALVTLLIACGGRAAPTPSNTGGVTAPADDPRARAFVLRMIDVLERGDLDAWIDLMSAQRQTAVLDSELVRPQLEAWQRDVLPLAAKLKRARIWIDRSGQTFVMYQVGRGEPTALVMVAEESTGLRIDEN